MKSKTVTDRLIQENARLLDDLVKAENRYQRDVYGLNNEGDPIGGEPAGGFANELAHYKKLWLDARLVEITKEDIIVDQYYWVADVKNEEIFMHSIGDGLVFDRKYRVFGPIPKPQIKEELASANAS